MQKKINSRVVTKEEIPIYQAKNPIEIINSLKIPYLYIPILLSDIWKTIGKNIDSIKLFPCIKDAILTISKRDILVGILSSNSKGNIKNVLSKYGLADKVNFIYSISNLLGKTSALKRILKEEELNKNKVLYIGDEVRDIDACRRIGIKVGCVTWGFNNKTLLVKNNPDYIFHSVKELLDLLEI